MYYFANYQQPKRLLKGQKPQADLSIESSSSTHGIPAEASNLTLATLIKCNKPTSCSLYHVQAHGQFEEGGGLLYQQMDKGTK